MSDTKHKPGWYKIAPKHGKKPANRAWANQPGVKRSSLTHTPGRGWSKGNP
jgi:hypothetical protein